MPTLMVYVDPRAQEALTDPVFNMLCSSLAEKVAKVFELKDGAKAVSAYLLPAVRSYNAAPMQIHCLASETDGNRAAKVELLMEEMQTGLRELKSDPQCKRFLEEVGVVEVWPAVWAAKWGEEVFTSG